MSIDINYIIQKALERDKIYQEILLMKLKPLIYSNIYKYYNYSNQEVEDLAQEGYIVILNAINTFDKSKKIHFLHYVKINLMYFYKNYYMKNKKQSMVETLTTEQTEITDSSKRPSDVVMSKEEKIHLYSCIQQLKPKEQIIIYLYYYKDYSMKEISKNIKIPYRTAIGIKANGIRKLRRLLNKKR